jgi:hypothetical protein
MSIDFAQINWLAVPVAAVAAFLVGGLWYGLIFARKWVALSGYTEEQTQVMAKKQPRNLGIFLVVDVIMAIVVSLLVINFEIASAGPGAALGVLLWLGVVVPVGGARHAANDQPLALWFIDTAHDLVVLAVMGAIIGAWR